MQETSLYFIFRTKHNVVICVKWIMSRFHETQWLVQNYDATYVSKEWHNKIK